MATVSAQNIRGSSSEGVFSKPFVISRFKRIKPEITCFSFRYIHSRLSLTLHFELRNGKVLWEKVIILNTIQQLPAKFVMSFQDVLTNIANNLISTSHLNCIIYFSHQCLQFCFNRTAPPIYDDPNLNFKHSHIASTPPQPHPNYLRQTAISKTRVTWLQHNFHCGPASEMQDMPAETDCIPTRPTESGHCCPHRHDVV